MSTVLITGANRGLGLEFCRQYASQGCKVIAGCRNPAQADVLNRLQSQFPEALQVEMLDVADFSHIDVLSKKLADQSIDILINNAGVYEDHKDNGFGRYDYSLWQHSLRINALAPVKMTEAFLPQIKLGNKKLIANVSSLMGSVADNDSGGSLYYRSSKAALNAAMKTLSIDLKGHGVGVLILHPGWVLTDMGGPNALIDSKTSVSGMCEQIEKFTMAQTGSFIKYDGKMMPW